jgi:multisubunit Na+/H+ antiporter MnhB subunit
VWTQDRLQSAKFIASVSVAVAIVTILALVVSSIVRNRRNPDENRPPLVLTGVVVLALLVASALVIVINDAAFVPTTGPAIVAASLALFAFVASHRTSRAPTPQASVVVATLVCAAFGGAAVLALPGLRHPMPSQPLIAWWAAHRNPPFGWTPALASVGEAVSATPRSVERVEAACESLRREFVMFAGEPRPPSDLAGDVAVVGADLVAVADYCNEHAATATREELAAMVTRATSTPAARRIDAALHVQK